MVYYYCQKENVYTLLSGLLTFYSYMLPAHRLISRCNSYCSVRSVDLRPMIARPSLRGGKICSGVAESPTTVSCPGTIRNRIDKNCILIRIKSLFSQLKQRDRNRLFTLRTFKRRSDRGEVSSSTPQFLRDNVDI